MKASTDGTCVGPLLEEEVADEVVVDELFEVDEDDVVEDLAVDFDDDVVEETAVLLELEEDVGNEIPPPAQALLPHVWPDWQTFEHSSPTEHLTLGKSQQTAPAA